MTLNQQKIENYVIIPSLKSETMGKLINRILGSRLLGCMLNSSASLAMSTSVLEALPGKLDIKRHSPSILYISASLAMSTSVLEALPGKLDIKRHSSSILYLFSPETKKDNAKFIVCCSHRKGLKGYHLKRHQNLATFSNIC